MMIVPFRLLGQNTTKLSGQKGQGIQAALQLITFPTFSLAHEGFLDSVNFTSSSLLSWELFFFNELLTNSSQHTFLWARADVENERQHTNAEYLPWQLPPFKQDIQLMLYAYIRLLLFVTRHFYGGRNFAYLTVVLSSWFHLVHS